ncbi:hypothetical protein THAOC_14511 [Thalassiosira oceanica]|uniref:NADP-dependent oxidoreductase domain-containing protein n=1 Tax=Thalassiosira oceanica TaxID=159749 RepID=K0SUQ8_THAOC|nr:hypothetical protein THAOC_14511 [Thalassiosira oceanica]|eukprot:EJK64726.1 hypothetical protein THAOC_14511 [Thalassiosira oceanica]
MDYVKLGSSDLEVSKVCMGTMTFGQQNTEKEGVEQLNLAFDQYGINFLDTAELYPVPSKAETQGMTDKTVAEFLKGRRREEVVLATKVCGKSQMDYFPRKEKTTTSLTKEQILYSVDKSLERLGTDHIDLLQLHWPDRYVGSMFGQADFTPSQVREAVPFEETLEALQILIEKGKVRYAGVSNESPFGVCSMIELAKQSPDLYPRIVSIQNSYSLVVRKDFESGLAESCYHHKVGLLPYSPLAGGSLTGKYAIKEDVPENCRYKMFPGFMDRYYGSQNEKATIAYAEIAKDKGLTPTQVRVALVSNAFAHVSDFISFPSLRSLGAIIVNTSLQLSSDIKAYDIKLDEATLKEIDQVYKLYTDPTKFA